MGHFINQKSKKPLKKIHFKNHTPFNLKTRKHFGMSWNFPVGGTLRNKKETIPASLTRNRRSATGNDSMPENGKDTKNKSILQVVISRIVFPFFFCNVSLFVFALVLLLVYLHWINWPSFALETLPQIAVIKTGQKKRGKKNIEDVLKG